MMESLVLKLPDDRRGPPGKWFSPCFHPLRSIFDKYFWVFTDQPWMGAPSGFDETKVYADYLATTETTSTLWRPGTIGHWADHFCEEHIELWAVKPDQNAAILASD